MNCTDILIFVCLFIIIYLVASNEGFANTKPVLAAIPAGCGTLNGYVETSISGKCNGISTTLAIKNCKKNTAGKYDLQLINNKLHCNPLQCPIVGTTIAVDANGEKLLKNGDPYCISCPVGSAMYRDANGDNKCAKCTNGALLRDASGNLVLDENKAPTCIPVCNTNFYTNPTNNICYPTTTVCPTGYKLEGGLCKIQPATICKTGTGTLNANFLCDPRGCPANYSMDASNNCLYNCPFGYSYNTKTRNCDPICPANFGPVIDPVTRKTVCSTLNTKKCNLGFDLIDGFCVQVCPDNKVPYVDKSGNPVKNATGNYTCIDSCLSGTIMSNNQCVPSTCPVGNVLYTDPTTNNSYCRNICSPGETYNTKTGKCISNAKCPSFLVRNIDANGNSYCTCPTNYTMSTDLSGNTKCNPICPQGLTLSSYGPNSQPNCTATCKTGYKMQLDENNRALCVPNACAGDEYLNNNVCTKICKEGFSYNKATNMCSPINCPINFTVVPDSNFSPDPSMTSSGGATLKYGKCYQRCPTNLVYDTTTNTCVTDLNNPLCPKNYSKDANSPHQKCTLINKLAPTYVNGTLTQGAIY
jgi:hypothetical protein